MENLVFTVIMDKQMNTSPDRLEEEVEESQSSSEEQKQVEAATTTASFSVETEVLEEDVVAHMKKVIDIDAIMEDPDEPPEVIEQKKVGELLKEWKISEALQRWFDILISALIGKKKEIGLNHFKKYLIADENDGKKIEDMTAKELQQSIDRLNNKLGSGALSVSQKLRFTYSLSKILDEKTKRETNKQMTPEQLLAANIKPWDILLANKNKIESTKNLLATKAIQYAQDDAWTHVMIVESIDPDGTVHIIHSTTDKGSNGKDGVQRWTLNDYIKKYNGGDVLALSLDSGYRQSFLKNIQERLWYGYGHDDITRAATNSPIDKDPSTVSCVTLATDSFMQIDPQQFSNLQNAHFPKDIVSSLHFTPSYMTTIMS